MVISFNPCHSNTDLSILPSHGGVFPTVTTLRSPSSISRSVLLSSSFLSWPEGNSFGVVLLALLALLAASRVRSRAVVRDQ
jgi:hypothetical protein